MEYVLIGLLVLSNPSDPRDPSGYGNNKIKIYRSFGSKADCEKVAAAATYVANGYEKFICIKGERT